MTETPALGTLDLLDPDGRRGQRELVVELRRTRRPRAAGLLQEHSASLPPSPLSPLLEGAGAGHRGTDCEGLPGQAGLSRCLARGWADRRAPVSGQHSHLGLGCTAGQWERLSRMLPRPCPRTRWSACPSTTSQPGATTRPSRRPATGVCPARSPRTRPRTASLRGRYLCPRGWTACCLWDRHHGCPPRARPPGGETPQ